MNPFETMFGREPKEYINREEECEMILRSFKDESSLAYLITGVRGCGKTVLMTHVANKLMNNPEWIVVDLNPETDLLSSLISRLYAKAGVSHLFIKKDLSFSIYGISLTLTSGDILKDPETILEVMFKEIKRKNKKVLITIDEVSNGKDMRIFAHAYQSLIRQQFPVFVLMTGLYENFLSLQNEKSLTFLYRAPKMSLDKLSSISIYHSYLRIFNDEKMAKEMAILVDGYAFAYQLLGKIVYEQNKKILSNDVLQKFDEDIANYCYSKIWEECNETEKKIIMSIYKTGGSVADIMDELSLNKSIFSVYRDRLLKKGFVDGSKRGQLTVTLPRFDTFINNYYMF